MLARVYTVCYLMPFGFPDEMKEGNRVDCFWDRSWEQADPERIAKYIEAFDTRPDALTDILRRYGVQTVYDAGCGCGAYAVKLAANGFCVSGFDVSARRGDRTDVAAAENAE